MSYVDSQLLPNENVVYRSKLHWRLFLLPGLAALLCVIAMVSALHAHEISLAGLLLTVAVILLLIPTLIRANSEFAVTNKRIICKLGVVTTHTVELLLPKVEAISVDQTLFGKILGYGDIVVTGSGGTREELKSVTRPLDLRRAVQAASTSIS